MPRPGDRDRATTVYLPSKETFDEWEEAAKSQGTSLSNYIFEMATRGREKETTRQKSSTRRDVEERDKAIDDLRKEVQQKELLLKRYESELYTLRFGAFVKVDPDEATEFDTKLIDVLNEGRVIDGYAILKLLGVDPKDTQTMKLVSNQLESLRRFGLVREEVEGWRWIG